MTAGARLLTTILVLLLAHCFLIRKATCYQILIPDGLVTISGMHSAPGVIHSSRKSIQLALSELRRIGRVGYALAVDWQRDYGAAEGLQLELRSPQASSGLR
ncbi:hypothetical protein BDV98DRAFT_585742 [Pterulicium gracile]|uniref:Uncharacterized protein n=1 Tax=Pterulicium gracile TaxID=1884261 RepID=A0A5C3Q5G3_9AGAR|nr:hypothetical protein BDV98DRAFT_585742 [Pterula gracilis]